MLLLYYPEESHPFLKVAMKNTGGVWHVSVANLPPSFEYLYQSLPQDALHKGNQGMLDPYARDLNTPTLWNQRSEQTIRCHYHTPTSCNDLTNVFNMYGVPYLFIGVKKLMGEYPQYWQRSFRWGLGA